MPKTYTVKQVANLLGLSTNTIYKYLNEGAIKANRISNEGRFRIQESEIVKLTGKTITPESTTAYQPILHQTTDGKTIHHHPFISDWFIAVTGMVITFTLFVLTEPIQSNYPLILNTSLLIFSVLYLVTTIILISYKKLIALLLTACYLLLTFSLLQKTDYITAGYMIITGLVVFISSSYQSPWGIIKSFHTVDHKKITMTVSVLSSLVNMILTFILISYHLWTAATIHLSLAYFSLLIPLEAMSPALAYSNSKHQSLNYVIGLILIFCLGFSIAFTNHGFSSLSISDHTAKALASVAKLSENYIKSGEDKVINISWNPELINQLSQSQPNTKILQQIVKSLYFANPAFRRTSISDLVGNILTSYPPLSPLESPVVNIATSDYFQTALQQKSPVISQPFFINSDFSSPEVVIAAPIILSSKVIGTVIGNLNLNNLKNLIINSTPTLNTKFTFLGENQKIFMQTNSDLEIVGQIIAAKSTVPGPKWEIGIQIPYTDFSKDISFIPFLIFNTVSFFGITCLFAYKRQTNTKQI